MITLAGKAALVTGASRGIGAGIALSLAASGAEVAVNYSGSQSKAEEVVRQIISEGGSAFAVQASVEKPDRVKALFAALHARNFEPDILVNNAGITRDNLFIRLSDEDFETVISVNLKGAIYCTREALPAMLRKGYGKVINISSVVGYSGNPGQANYSASKGALAAFSRSCAAEFGYGGVRVNTVAPGFIKTDMTAALPEEIKKGMLSSIPLGRAGTAEEVANAVNWLASPLSDYVTGQTLHINGGMYL
ncbi:MAG: 3-oxoacyl-[acyl-carrier-protein] reductase [Deferribacteraceae bacterium]|jgi:3-oxoacyl-[acyl-carrier protein] reductase|nr:3-oxoacyl-[acyl-carrier-protein] reductase [Deferribacteraceae bacterium]